MHSFGTILEESESVDVDTMLAYAGDFGRYQFILMILFSFVNVASAFHYFAQTFISVIPGHTCVNGNAIIADHCEADQFKYNLPINETACGVKEEMFGYVGIVEEYNWFCNDDWKPALGQSVFFIGSVLGSLILGYLSDSIGRLHVLVITYIFAFIGNIMTIFSKEIVSFSISRFIAGIATDNNFTMMYIIVLEYIRPSMRTFGLNLCIGVFYCLGCVIVPWVAVFAKSWDKFLIIVSVPQLFVIAFYFIVAESAQWLISQGKIEKAIQCFKRIASINKRDISETTIEGLRLYSMEHITKAQSSNLLGLFKTPNLRRKTCILIFKSMVLTLCYDAISKNVNGLGYSPFILFSVSSSNILPASLLILAIQDRVGRKALASCALFLTGVFTLSAGYILATYDKPDTLLAVSLMFVARFGVTIAYNSGTQYAVELIPTEVRGQGVSAIHVCGYAATFFSAHILYLGELWKPFPEFVLGILLMAGAVACLFLPETLNRTLPITLDDGEMFGENEGVFQFDCFKANKHAPTESTLQIAEFRQPDAFEPHYY